ncbi:MAG: T9SS type A sorting domain-containing protein [Aureispira sp.]|nr:T9SS type A sorting domain-containing protein [Aureispira sp.]
MCFRKLFIGIVTNLLLTINLLGQYQYVPMPTQNATWSYTHYIFGAPPIPMGIIVCDYTAHYRTLGDTLISGDLYTKIYVNYDSSIVSSSTSVYDFAIYEDPNKEVWTRRSNDTMSHLLYDFGASVGDTICSTIHFFPPSVCNIVTRIDTINVGGTLRRRMELTLSTDPFAGPSTVWIEGIGNVDAPFMGVDFISSHIVPKDPELVCFHENNQKIYGNFTGNGTCHCQVILPIEKIKQTNIELTVAPNPAKDIVIFKVEGKMLLDLELEVFDLVGRSQKRIRLEDNQAQLDSRNWPKGVYIYRLKNDKQLLNTGKLIIQ